MSVKPGAADTASPDPAATVQTASLTADVACSPARAPARARDLMNATSLPKFADKSRYKKKNTKYRGLLPAYSESVAAVNLLAGSRYHLVSRRIHLIHLALGGGEGETTRFSNIGFQGHFISGRCILREFSSRNWTWSMKKKKKNPLKIVFWGVNEVKRVVRTVSTEPGV